MKHFLVVLLVLIPASALAQALDPEEPPRPPGLAQALDPEEPPRPPGPAPSYGPAPAPMPVMERHGVTFEANLGLGLVWARADGDSSETETALAGLDLGLGGWLRNDLALSVRIAGATFSPSNGVQFTTGFVGPSLQYWTDDHFWIGGGAGLAFVSAQVDAAAEQPTPNTGFGLDVRAGYTFNAGSENTVNLSLELNPGFFSVATGTGSNLDVNINSFGVLLGYQHL